jgi:DNA topoisomerase I
MINRPVALEWSILQTLFRNECDQDGGYANWQIDVCLKKNGQRAFSVPLVHIKGLPAGLVDEPRLQAVVLDLKEQLFQVVSYSKQTLQMAPPGSMTQTELYLDPDLISLPTELLEKTALELQTMIVNEAPLVRGFAAKQKPPAAVWYSSVREWIVDHYDVQYLAPTARPFKLDQPHDILLYPSQALLTPKKMKKKLAEEHYRVYMKIWERFVASQMTSATVQRMEIKVSAGNNQRYFFERRHQEITERGFMQALPLQQEGRMATPFLTGHVVFHPGEELKLMEVIVQKNARPIFYANAAELYHQWRGSKNFTSLKFRAALINLATQNYIEATKKGWRLTDQGRQEAAEISSYHASVQADPSHCEKCGSLMELKQGPYGRFLGCSAFPKCRFTRAFHLAVYCPADQCSGHIVERQTKNGKRFYGCSRYPDCEYRSWEKPTNIICYHCHGAALMRQVDDRGQERLSCPQCGHMFEPQKAGILTT